MENICKKLSWINLLTIVLVILATVFGCLAGDEVERAGADSGLRSVLIVISLVAGIILLISSIVSFFTMRSGDAKSSIIALGKHTRIQFVAPLVIYILGAIGLANRSLSEGPVSGSFIFLTVSFITLLFTYGFNSGGLRSFRKDKSSFSYLAITTFICIGALILFTIASSLAMKDIPAFAEGNHFVGYVITFAVLFMVADLVCYVLLASIAITAKRYAPSKTLGDVDANYIENINSASARFGTGYSHQANVERDNISVLREYKKLLDEGVITKEEFEKKKKELL